MRDDDAEGRPARPVSHEIGCDLSTISVDELQARIVLLQAEIERLRAEESRKVAVREAAGSLFRI